MAHEKYYMGVSQSRSPLKKSMSFCILWPLNNLLK